MSREAGRGFYETFWSHGIGDWTPQGKFLDDFERHLFEIYFPVKGTIIDYGCGDGSHSGDFLQNQGFEYTGVDIADTALEKCRERGLNVVRFNDDFTVPLDSESVDGVVCFEVLEHIFDPVSSVAEITRLLKPGHWLVGSVPNVAFIGNRILMLFGMFNPGGSPTTSLKRPWADPHIRFFSYKSVRMFLKECNLRDVSVYSTEFSLLYLPRVYKTSGRLRAFIRHSSRPLAWLGKAFPSLFSSRIYFVARK